MTLLTAIEKANALRPNAFDDAMKADWIIGLEAEIAEMMYKDRPCKEYEDPENTYPSDKELLMPYPHDGFYVPYLCAMIDEANEETELYQDDMTIATVERQNACSWWWRNNRPVKPKYIRGL